MHPLIQHTHHPTRIGSEGDLLISVTSGRGFELQSTRIQFARACESLRIPSPARMTFFRSDLRPPNGHDGACPSHLSSGFFSFAF